MLNELSKLYAYTRFQEPITYDPENLLVKAKEFAGTNQALFRHIESIMCDDAFRTDPASYLECWNERRGCLETFRTIEDQALDFFNRLYKF